MKSGFIAIVGRPNVGKSSLLNTIVDANVAITSSKPETTRNSIKGILTTEDAQFIFVDTPGIHRPRTSLGKRLNSMVNEQISVVDLILFLTPVDEVIARGDQFILENLQKVSQTKTNILAVISKIDKSKDDVLFEKMNQLSKYQFFREIVPVSAKSSRNVDHLLDVIKGYLPEGPALYDENDITDQSKYEMIEEVIRGESLENLEKELPHSLVVKVEEIIDREIFVNIYLERDSQKGIILGKNGANIKNIRLKSTRIIKEMLGKSVHLNLKVKVAKNWQDDPKMLDRFGF